MNGSFQPQASGSSDKYRKHDFSSQSIKREVHKSTAQNPLVLYPMAVGLLAALSAVVFGPTSWLLGAGLLGISGGAGAWFYHSVIRRDIYISKYLRQLRLELGQQVQRSIQRLEKILQQNHMDKPLNQLQRLKNKFSIFEDMLKSKFDENEITYERYLGMTEQVFMAGLDNLQKSADIAKGLSAINKQHLEKRLSELKSQDQLDPSVQKELEALLARNQLVELQENKIQQYLTQNEQAMTQIDKLMAAIASLENSSSRRATMEMEDAMQELSRLADRAQDYQNNL